MESLAFTVACTPTTAFNLRSATVVAGSARFTWPALSCATSVLGSASTSTLSPTASAVVGLTPCTTWCIFSVSVQNASSPNVSNRKMCCPSSSVRSMGELVGVGVESVHAATDATSAAINQRCIIGHLSVKGCGCQTGGTLRTRHSDGRFSQQGRQAGKRPFRSAGRNGPRSAMSARAWSTCPHVFHNRTPRTRPSLR